jgi:hypothetical protein
MDRENGDRYKSYAREFIQWANESTDDEVRQVLLQVAKIWTQRAINERTAVACRGNSQRIARTSVCSVLTFLDRQCRKLRLRLRLLHRR